MISIKSENDKLVISLSGRIDSANAPDVEREIFAYPDLSKYPELVLDAEELDYISSAGLRVILRLRKQVPGLKIVNVSSAVYEILEMTGFSEMIPVEKAYRKLSVDGCEILGEGSNGIVYRYDPDTIIKVYRNPDALEEIHRERDLARKAFVLGIPTAIPYDVVKVGEGYGSVFELLNAKSFSKLIAAEPERIDYYVEQFVELLKKIHGTEVSTTDMTDMKAVALDWAEYLKDYLEPALYEKLTGLIKAVPERHNMIHGDYHTNNVELQNGEVLLIDMDTLAYGHPIFELASMFLGFAGFGELNPTICEKFLKLPYETAVSIWKKSLKLYLNTDDEDAAQEVAKKAMIIGYARLMRRTIKRIGFEDEEGRRTIENCREKLTKLLGEVDTLTF